jgi:hypothetical protein
MTDDELVPEGLAKRLFVLTMMGVVAYVAAIVVMMSSPDDPSAANETAEGAVAQRAP